MAIFLPAGLQNSHQNGGPLFLIFVANPRTVWLCKLKRHRPLRRAGDEAWARPGRLALRRRLTPRPATPAQRGDVPVETNSETDI